MARNLETGDLYAVKYQLLGMESLLDPAVERLRPFRSAVEDTAAEKSIEAGARYDRVVRSAGMNGERGFNAVLPRTSAATGAVSSPGSSAIPTVPYGKAAVAQLEAHPDLSRGAGRHLPA